MSEAKQLLPWEEAVPVSQDTYYFIRTLTMWSAAQIFRHFTFARFSFTIRAKTCIRLPVYKGGTLRGAFGYALKRIVCVHKRAVCDDCILEKQCVYGYIFDTSPPDDSEILSDHSDVPRPFIIEPPLDRNTYYRPGDEITFGLVLIGKAIELLPYFILAFEKLGEAGIGRGRGKFSLQKVESNDRVIYPGNSETLLQEPGILNVSDLPTDPNMNGKRITLRFLTPLRMKYQGRLTNSPEFHILIRNLLRRISSLAYLHCGITADMDPSSIIASVSDIAIESMDIHWYDWRRYSSRQEAQMTLGGLIGRVTYIGEMKPFLPLLRIGEYIHIGKNTSFGLGKYVILWDA